MLIEGEVKSVSNDTATGVAALPAASDTVTDSACVPGVSPTLVRSAASAACGTLTAHVLAPAPANTGPE